LPKQAMALKKETRDKKVCNKKLMKKKASEMYDWELQVSCMMAQCSG